LGTEIRCKKCGHTLFEFAEIPHDVLWYSRLTYQLGEKCPKCGHKLPDVSNYAHKMLLEVKSITPVLAK
jgi:DNA-directed RNA polymerase subunit RPC12/RpoP